MATKNNTPLSVETLKHEDATRKNIPTAEYQSVMKKEQQSPVRVAYPREREGRNRDLDPQLLWRGKDEQDWSDLVVHAPPLYIQEKVHPKVLIDDLKRQTERAQGTDAPQVDMFADFNGLPNEDAKTEFYAHDAHWANRMILGDSLAVMASLAEREGLRGKVQCIYFDPPYGIKFNSNFQWSTTSRDVKDGNAGHITREPEQVKAFRDTWRDGIHSYLTYLRDRLTVARDLLSETGSIFVQIGDENVHRVRALMDEVFGDENFMSQITLQKTGGLAGKHLKGVADFVLWFARDSKQVKYRQLLSIKKAGAGDNPGKRYDQLERSDLTRRALSRDEKVDTNLIPIDAKIYQLTDLTSISSDDKTGDEYIFQGSKYFPPANRHWSTKLQGRNRLEIARRIVSTGKRLMFVRYLDDFPAYEISNIWDEFAVTPDVRYVVQTHPGIISRCIQMTSDPGDLVLDPTCGSGTTAYVAEQWGRRWITIDTSRVALALARARIMGARYSYYLLADSRDGQIKEAEVTRTVPSSKSARGDVREGFVYERVPHITLKSIAKNAEIDIINVQYQAVLEPLREQLNRSLGTTWAEWDVPREAESKWPLDATKLHTELWKQRIARQQAIDASIAAKAEFEFLYDKPYEDKCRIPDDHMVACGTDVGEMRTTLSSSA